ncbi:MAG: GNAT family N-acetyltransferase [Lachnospiraceae bacterium]|nr:GNAT family N-acetyltransferase [Lachnospiraceae bacterium]
MELRQLFNKKNIIKPVCIEVRPLCREHWNQAMSLAWYVFNEFDAKDYSERGIESFWEFITDETLHKMFIMGSYHVFGAYDKSRLVGIITLRNETHISLLFVDPEYHRLGIGRRLMAYLCQYVKQEEGYNFITVNAAPYATGFYHKLGFKDTGKEQINDGITYTPMKLFNI